MSPITIRTGWTYKITSQTINFYQTNPHNKIKIKTHQNPKFNIKKERGYVENEVLVIGDKSQASSVMEVPRQHKKGYYHTDHSYYWEDWEPDHWNRHFSFITVEIERRRSRVVLTTRSNGW